MSFLYMVYFGHMILLGKFVINILSYPSFGLPKFKIIDMHLINAPRFALRHRLVTILSYDHGMVQRN